MEKYTVKLSQEERKNLLSLMKTGKHAASKILHARILLASDEGDYADSESIKTDEKVARLLDISEKTVKSHISNILNKLGLRDRMQVVLYYLNGRVTEQ